MRIGSEKHDPLASLGTIHDTEGTEFHGETRRELLWSPGGISPWDHKSFAPCLSVSLGVLRVVKQARARRGVVVW